MAWFHLNLRFFKKSNTKQITHILNMIKNTSIIGVDIFIDLQLSKDTQMSSTLRVKALSFISSITRMKKKASCLFHIYCCQIVFPARTLINFDWCVINCFIIMWTSIFVFFTVIQNLWVEIFIFRLLPLCVMAYYKLFDEL